MKDSYLSTQKKTGGKGMTNHKSQFSFAPEEGTIQKSAITLKESQLMEKQNREQNMYAKLSKVTYSQEHLQSVTNEHRLQVQKLLLQVSRLHDVIYDLERVKKHDIQKLKEEYEHMTYLHVNNLKNSQISQIQVLQTQVRKYKEALTIKMEEYDDLKHQNYREKERLQTQIQNLQMGLKQFVDRKNNEIFTIQEESQKQIRHLKQEREVSTQEVKDLCERQIKKIQRKLYEKEEDLGKIKEKSQRVEEKNEELQKQLENDRAQVQQKMLILIKENEKKRQEMSNYMEKMLGLEQDNGNEQLELQKQVFISEIDNLMNVIGLKDKENERNLALLQTQGIQIKRLIQMYERQNNEIKEEMRRHRNIQLQEIQNLKVKMAVLHQNDIQGLKQVYETKIDGLNLQLKRSNDELARARAYIHEETHRTYELKKNYDYKISKLTSKIIQLQNGLQGMQLDMKQKLYNERSAMLLTSKSLIGDVQLKNTNVKFYEEQLRKLRQLVQTLTNQLNTSQQDNAQQRKYSQQQIKRLTGKVNELEREKSQSQEHWNKNLDNKNNQLRELNRMLNQLSIPQYEEDHKGKQITRLQEKLMEKEDNIRALQLRCQQTQKSNAGLRVQNQQLELENQVSHEEVKKDFDKIAQMQLSDMKKLYERKLKQLQDDKEMLQQRNSGQSQHISELVRRYKELQSGMKALMQQMKKRGQLQSRILNVGMDQNLVKNMVQLFHQ